MAQASDFVRRYQATLRAFLTAFEDMQAMQEEWTAMSFSGSIQDADVSGVIPGANAADFKTGMTAAASIWTSFTGAAQAGQLYKLR